LKEVRQGKDLHRGLAGPRNLRYTNKTATLINGSQDMVRLE
jgi:hypothetical protein